MDERKLLRTGSKRIKGGNGGFTLVELLIAVCILAVAVIPMLRSFISSLYANAKARERLSAMMVAERTL